VNKSKVLKVNTFNVKEFTSTIFAKMSESIGDMVITIAITGVVMIYIPQLHPVYLDIPVSGFFAAAMIVQLLIRIVHRFDNSYTAHEVGEKLQRFEDHFDSRIDELFNNLVK